MNWRKILELAARGAASAEVVYLGVQADTPGSPAVFDTLATTGSLKAMAAGAALSFLFSIVSGQFGDPGEPTVTR